MKSLYQLEWFQLTFRNREIDMATNKYHEKKSSLKISFPVILVFDAIQKGLKFSESELNDNLIKS